MEKRFLVYATKRQARAVRNLIDLLERIAPYGNNTRSFMWPERDIAMRLVTNIELTNPTKE